MTLEVASAAEQTTHQRETHAMPETPLLDSDKQKLQHMLGATPGHHPKRVWGFRNRYATSGGEALEAMRRMEGLGLVEHRGMSGDMHYFQATEAGCRAVGLVGKQTRNALEE